MSDRMRQIPFGQLMMRVLGEYKYDNTVFGIRKLYDHKIGQCGKIFGRNLELPMGPAAGPHTQLSQNIIAAYAAGARFFELKTVQVLDGEDLPVSKPCISAADEGYNVEWSTELYVPQALDEYVKAWFALKLISRELGLGSDDGFVFNMSVGYDLEGIKTVKIDSFIEALKNAEETDYWKTCKEWAYDNQERFNYVDKHMLGSIDPCISNSITLSTLHGCPPDEIERIAEYLLREKGLHTYIKCNPTLAGFDFARNTLSKLGYDYIIFDEKHFNNDLQFEDAVPMLRRLKKLASELSLEFGVKLTNTFPVQIKAGELPGEEMYMSGRALFPLSVEVARRLTEAFGGELSISYSGGADARNIAELLSSGIRPVTLATTLLKPGGYEKLYQIACIVSDGAQKCPQKQNVKLPLPDAEKDRMYRKMPGMLPDRKLKENLPLFDCYTAPCRSGCPFGQDVPAYLRFAGEGKYLEALRIITERNPLPFITGTICSHNCMNKCTRCYIDESVDIRGVKLEAAQHAYNELLSGISDVQKENKKIGKAAVIGGGPAGLAAAYFLARTGLDVTVFEKRDTLGGVVRCVIPEFRIDNSVIDKDIALIEAAGVRICVNTEITDIDKLREDGYQHIIAATGAWKPAELKLSEGSAVDALRFLEELKRNPGYWQPVKNVVVAGGGNTAMDCARAAVRMKGVKNVTLAYRRTVRNMPADSEEIEMLITDGIRICELVSPLRLTGGVLTCGIMKQGEPDNSGRPECIPTGNTMTLPCDLLISAIGNKADDSLFTGHNDVYVIGDASRGGASVAEAIADAAECARKITGIGYEKYCELNVNKDCIEKGECSVTDKRGIVFKDKNDCPESDKCLECAAVCGICTEVCPNRANIIIDVDERPQIVHIDFMCNECGNCETFCPYTGAPYLDKFSYFIYEQDFDESDNNGFLALEDGTIRVRLDGKVTEQRDGKNLPEDVWKLIEKTVEKFAEWFG